MSESNDTQIDLNTAYCRQRSYAVTPDRIFRDDAISGADADRPGLWNAIASLGRGDVLVAYAWDRIARDVYLSELIRREVRKKGARIEVVNGHNGQSDTDVAIQQVIAAFDALDRKTKAARTAAAMRRHQANNRAMGSIPPYGKMRGPDVTVLDSHGQQVSRRAWTDNPEEQPILKLILARDAAGWNPNEIATSLNRNGTACRGRKWDRKTIKRICARHRAIPAVV